MYERLAADSRAMHYAQRRDYGIVEYPATSKNRTVMPFEELKRDARGKLLVLGHKAIMETLVPLVAGTTISMDMFFVQLLQRYSEEIRCKQSQGVRLAKLWHDPLTMFTALGCAAKIEARVRSSIMQSHSVDELMVAFEDCSVNQSASRALRKMFPGIFWSERRLSKASKDEDAAAVKLFGLPKAVENGYVLDIHRVSTYLMVWALTESAHPAAMDEVTTSPIQLMEEAQARQIAEVERIELRVEEVRKGSNERESSDEYDSSDEGDNTDDELSTLEQEEKKRTEEMARLERRLLKLGAAAKQVVVKKERAERTGICELGSEELCVTSVKQKCFGGGLAVEQLHREGIEEIDVLMKAVLDGRLILRHLMKSKQAQQAALMISCISSNSRVNSRKNIFGVGVCEGGECGAGGILAELCATIKQQRAGVDIGVPILVQPRAEPGSAPVLLTNVKVKPRWVIVPDGAMYFKVCEGKCGGSAKLPCPCCMVFKGNHTNEAYNIGFAFVVYTVQPGDTPNSIAGKTDMNYELLSIYNNTADKSSEASWKCLTTTDHNSTTPANSFTPSVDIKKFQPDEIIVKSRARRQKKIQIRVRLVREMNRPLTSVWSNAGIGWDMFCFCATHADCKLLEHQIFHLVRLSGFSPKKVNAWLLENGCKIEFDQKDKKYAKARFSTQNQCDLWFEDIETKDGRVPRYQAACEFFDPGNRSTLQVWKALVPLRKLYLLLYPTPEQQSMAKVYTLQYFVAYRLRYKSKDVHFYMHMMFAHATGMMDRFHSWGLLRNEGEENVNSEDKKYIECHSTRGGCGGNMCFDVIKYYTKKLFRTLKRTLVSHIGIDTTKLITIPFSNWLK